jgi:nucleoside-diphosphate-sugar epimerase
MYYLGHDLMHFMVTGAQGFLGQRVVNALRARGYVVTAVGRRAEEGVVCCDLTVKQDVVGVVEQVAPDRIVHCAADVPKTPEEYMNGSSADASLRMLDNVSASSACPLVYISSMTVYGKNRNRPVSEEDAGDPSSAYGKAKWQGEQRLAADGRSGRALRIPGLFGPSRRDGLVFNVMHAAKYGWTPQLPPAPILWAAMHVDDAAESIASLAILPMDDFEAVNVGYCGIYSIANLVSVAAAAYGRQISYEVKQSNFEFDLTRAERYGALPACSFREALVKFGNQI